MLKPENTLKILTIVACLALASAAWAGERGHGRDTPRHYSPHSLDGAPVSVGTADGAQVTAWSYWAGRESAIAISTRDSDGLWSDPVFVGLDDRVSQVEPALVRDAHGTLYLAYAERESGTVWMSALFGDNEAWFAPQRVSEPGDRVGRPALRIVGDRLVLAYSTRSGDTRMADFALLPDPASFRIEGVQEGPDGFPLTGDYRALPEEPGLPGDGEGDRPVQGDTSFGKGGGESKSNPPPPSGQ